MKEPSGECHSGRVGATIIDPRIRRIYLLGPKRRGVPYVKYGARPSVWCPTEEDIIPEYLSFGCLLSWRIPDPDGCCTIAAVVAGGSLWTGYSVVSGGGRMMVGLVIWVCALEMSF